MIRLFEHVELASEKNKNRAHSCQYLQQHILARILFHFVLKLQSQMLHVELILK